MKKSMGAVCLAAGLLFSCNLTSEITKENRIVLDDTVTSVTVNNNYIPIQIEGVGGDEIIFRSHGIINYFTNDEIINEPVIKTSDTGILIYFQVFKDNQASYSFNTSDSENAPRLVLQIPSSYTGSLTINNYGYNAKASVADLPNLTDFIYLVIDSDLTMNNVGGESSLFYLDNANLDARKFYFDETVINAKTSCTISLSGCPGNLNATTQNYMPFDATYETYDGEIINIITYSGGGTLTLPKTAAFEYDLFSTSGLINFSGFDSVSSETDSVNKKTGTVSGSGVTGNIRYNSGTNTFSVVGR